MSDPQALADRYVEAWNERDAGERRQRIAALWVTDGVHYVGAREARGYKAIEERITGSHEKNVALAGNRFRAVKDASALRDVITFHWEMLSAHDDAVLAVGLEFLVLNAEERIVIDYQFIPGQAQPPVQGRVG
jgi:hypothetical protein